jgi:nitroimidazol reductase NimA-like FMN-containing flavoprotein (pyridoxamine 5'-phosphate oxidase superfamily)
VFFGAAGWRNRPHITGKTKRAGHRQLAEIGRDDVRRKDRDVTDTASIEDIIRNSLVCRLGMSRNDQPYVVPLSFGYSDKTLYFHSAGEGLKLDILQQNPTVCVEFDIDQKVVHGDKPCKWGMHYRSVIGFGQATIVSAPEEKQRALAAIMHQYSGSPYDFSQAEIKSVTILKVDIRSMTGKSTGY